MMSGEDRRTAREVHGLPDLRPLPHNIEIEQAVLGTLLMDNGLLSRCADILNPDCFFEELHRRTFSVIEGLIQQGKPATPITLKTYLGDQDLGGVTVREYLARLAAEVTIPSQIRDYAAMLNDLAVRRQMISIALDTLDAAYDAPVELTAKALVDGVLERVGSLPASPGEHSDYEAFDTASYRAMLTAQEAYQAEGRLVGLSTGFPTLDEALGGLQKTDLVILAGRPAMGKTSLATNIAFNVARHLQSKRREGRRTGVVAFCSLEMSSDQLSQRIISDQSGIPQWKVRRGYAGEEEMERLIIAQRELRGLPLDIDPTGEMTIVTLRLRTRALKKRKGLELLVVDYLQLLHGTNRSRDNRVQEVTEITTGLKALAKELEVPVLALSQLSRRVEERPDKRPMLSDLRESGSIEQDADIVMFVYREEYYLQKEKPPTPGTEARFTYDCALIRTKGVAEIIIGKNRHGPEAAVRLGFDRDFTRFLNEPEEREPLPEREEKLKKAKKPALPKDAVTLYGVLRSLTMTAGEVPEDAILEADRSLKRKARIIPARVACDAYGRELLGPEADAAAVEKSFRAMMKALRSVEIAFYTGTKEAGTFVWLPEMVE